jgi:hypothetical protein
MMKRRKIPPHTTRPIREEVSKPEKQKSPIKQQDNNANISFTRVSNLLSVFVFADIISHAIDEIDKAQEDIEEISARINQGITIHDAQTTINSINLLISLKESILKLISWASVTASIVNCELENDNTPEQMLDMIPTVGEHLASISESMDVLLTAVPQEPVLGITLAPDQKQFSETKSMISKIISRLEEIKREDEEAEQDWGRAEQKAYDRLQEGSSQNIPVEEFLDWLAELERGNDV